MTLTMILKTCRWVHSAVEVCHVMWWGVVCGVVWCGLVSPAGFVLLVLQLVLLAGFVVRVCVHIRPRRLESCCGASKLRRLLC